MGNRDLLLSLGGKHLRESLKASPNLPYLPFSTFGCSGTLAGYLLNGKAGAWADEVHEGRGEVGGDRVLPGTHLLQQLLDVAVVEGKAPGAEAVVQHPQRPAADHRRPSVGVATSGVWGLGRRFSWG